MEDWKKKIGIKKKKNSRVKSLESSEKKILGTKEMLLKDTIG